MTIEQIEAMLTDIAERLARVDAEFKAIHEENEATAARLDEIGAGIAGMNDLIAQHERNIKKCCKQRKGIAKLTPPQRELLQMISTRGRVTQWQLRAPQRAVVKRLIAAGLVEAHWQHPQHGQDYGGYEYYTAN